jgi:hypothetical protein
MDIGGLDSFSKILFAEWPISRFLLSFPSFGNNIVRPIKFGLYLFDPFSPDSVKSAFPMPLRADLVLLLDVHTCFKLYCFYWLSIIRLASNLCCALCLL